MSTKHAYRNEMLPPCIRTFSEVDPFSYLTETKLGQRAYGKPDWGCYANGRPQKYSTFEAIKCLSLVTLIDKSASPSVATQLDLTSWTTFGSKILRAMDTLTKEKRFWTNQDVAVTLLAASELLTFVMLDLALHTQYLRDRVSVGELAQTCDGLTSRLKFCARKILTFRSVISDKLSLRRVGFLEQSALRLLQLTSSNMPEASHFVAGLKGLCQQNEQAAEYNGSKDLLLLQATYLGQTGLIKEAISSDARPNLVRYAEHLQRTALHTFILPKDQIIATVLSNLGAFITYTDNLGVDALNLVFGKGTLTLMGAASETLFKRMQSLAPFSLRGNCLWVAATLQIARD